MYAALRPTFHVSFGLPDATLVTVRWAPLVGGILLVIVGVIWIFQGVGALHGSFMTGSVFWERTGIACVVVGVPLSVIGARRAR